MEIFALFSTEQKPQRLQSRGLTSSNGYECEVPIPLPDMVLIFTLGSWPAELEGQMLRIQVCVEDMNKFTIGSVSKDNRAFCWQGSWRDDLYVKSELMSDADSKATLLLISEPLRPITPCPLNTPNSKETKKMTADGEEEDNPVECSQTESRRMEKQDEAEDEIKDTVIDDGLAERLKEDVEESESSASTGVSLLSVKKNSTTKTPTSKSAATTATSSNRKKRKTSGDAPEPKSRRSTGKRSTRTRLCLSTENKAKIPESKPAPKRDIMSFMKMGPKPSARWGHSLCDIGNNQALLIGGQGDKQILSKDSVWLLNTDTKEWEVPTITMDSHKPHYRMGHTATFDPKVRCLYVYGGSKNLRWYSDIHVLDLDTWQWSLVEANGKAPTRAYHSSTLFRNELFIFGGVFPNTDPEPDGCSNQVFVYSPVTESWYEPVLLGDRPKARSGHSATLLGEKLVIFGGWDAPVCYNDLHILDLCLMEFTSPAVSGKAPSPRSWHGAVALPGNRVLIHGGYDGDNALGDSFIFNLDTMSWSSIKLPIPVTMRAGHSLLSLTPSSNDVSSSEDIDEKENTPKRIIEKKQRLMVFAGGDNDGTFFNDLIRFSLKTEDL